jgi:hypothetical protein
MAEQIDLAKNQTLVSKPSDFLKHSCPQFNILCDRFLHLLQRGAIDIEEYNDLDAIHTKILLDICANSEAFDRIVTAVDLDFSDFIKLVKGNGELP